MACASTKGAKGRNSLIEADTNYLKVLNHQQKETQEVSHCHENVQVSYLKFHDQIPLKRKNHLRKHLYHENRHGERRCSRD